MSFEILINECLGCYVLQEPRRCVVEDGKDCPFNSPLAVIAKNPEGSWKSLLNSDELNHIQGTTESGTLKQFEKNAGFQKEMRDSHKDMEPCWDCKFIAEKLGIPV